MPLQAGSERQVFGVRRGRAARVARVALMMALLILGAVLLVAVLAAVARYYDRPLLGYIVGGCLALALLWVGWQDIRLHSHDMVEIAGGEVRLGRGWFRESAPLESVELIEVSETHGIGGALSWIDLCLRGRRRRLYLEDASAACASALRAACPDAIYIDLSGREAMPISEDRPAHVLRALASERLRRGWAMVVWSVACFVGGVVLARAAGSSEQLIIGRICNALIVLLCVVCVPLGVALGIGRIREGRRLAAQARLTGSPGGASTESA